MTEPRESRLARTLLVLTAATGLIDAVSYLAVIGSLLAMRITPRELKAVRQANILRQLRDGWEYIVGSPPISKSLLIRTKGDMPVFCASKTPLR